MTKDRYEQLAESLRECRNISNVRVTDAQSGKYVGFDISDDHISSRGYDSELAKVARHGFAVDYMSVEDEFVTVMPLTEVTQGK